MKFKHSLKCSYCSHSRLTSQVGRYAAGKGREVKYKPDILGYICSECDGQYISLRIKDLVKKGKTLEEARQIFGKPSFKGGIYVN